MNMIPYFLAIMISNTANSVFQNDTSNTFLKMYYNLFRVVICEKFYS